MILTFSSNDCYYILANATATSHTHLGPDYNLESGDWTKSKAETITINHGQFCFKNWLQLLERGQVKKTITASRYNSDTM